MAPNDTRNALKDLSQAVSQVAECLQNLASALSTNRERPKPPAETPDVNAEPRRVVIQPKEVVFTEGKTLYSRVYQMIANHPQGVSVQQMKKTLGIAGPSLANVLHRLKVDGKIKTRSRGVYVIML